MFKNQTQDVGLYCSQWKVREKNPTMYPPEQKARKVSFVTDFLQSAFSDVSNFFLIFFPQNTRRPDVVNNSNPSKPYKLQAV